LEGIVVCKLKTLPRAECPVSGAELGRETRLEKPGSLLTVPSEMRQPSYANVRRESMRDATQFPVGRECLLRLVIRQVPDSRDNYAVHNHDSPSKDAAALEGVPVRAVRPHSEEHA